MEGDESRHEAPAFPGSRNAQTAPQLSSDPLSPFHNCAILTASSTTTAPSPLHSLSPTSTLAHALPAPEKQPKTGLFSALGGLLLSFKAPRTGSKAGANGSGGGEGSRRRRRRPCRACCESPGALSIDGVGAGGPHELVSPASRASAVESSLSGQSQRQSGVSLRTVAAGSTDASTDVAKLPEAWNVVDYSELDLVKVIGEGSFGQVWVAKYCHTPVAVKVLTQQRAPEGASSSTQQRWVERQLSKEVAIMSKLRHPNCCQYLGIVQDPPCIIMEYCSRRSVDSILTAATTDPKVARQLTWARLLSMACDAGKGLLYLHSRHPPIVHRDLKSANLLVDTHWHVKVADFNVSKAVEVASTNTSTICITNPRWLAPEVLLGGQAQLGSDVWAFGTVLWELMTWKLPFDQYNPFQIIVTVTQAKEGSGLTIPPPHLLPAGHLVGYYDYVSLMRDCWRRDPAARPTMDAVVSRLLPMLSAELRRGSLTSIPSGTLPSPKTAPASSRGLGQGSSTLEAPSEGPPGGSSLSGASNSLEGRPSATEALLAQGHVTVANAGLSQMDSTTKGYPFVNPNSFFMRMRGELHD